MLEILYYAGALMVALGLLVTIHEYGHFWVARKMGVRVIRFSVGFGKPIYTWISKKDGVEYAIGSIPLGGYVKMFGEQNEEGVNDQNRDVAFCHKSIRARSAIVVAGPLANFIFAIFAFIVLFLAGTEGYKPYVTNTLPGTYASQAQFKPGDLMVAIDGERVVSWSTAYSKLFSGFFSNKRLLVDVVTTQGERKQRVVDFTNAKTDIEPQQFRQALGFLGGLPATVARLSDSLGLDSVARLHFLVTQQQLPFHFALPHMFTTRVIDLNTPHSKLAQSPAISAGLRENDQLDQIHYVPPIFSLQLHATRAIMPAAGFHIQYALGVGVYQTQIYPSRSWSQFAGVVSQFPARPIWLVVNRGEQRLSYAITPMAVQRGRGVQGFVGISPVDLYVEHSVERHALGESIIKSFNESYSMSVLMLKVFGKMITGEASRKNVSGLLTIAEYSGKTAKYGWRDFLRFLAVISISLGVINLLPIPILDGGHLVYFMIEAIKGSPVSENARAYGNVVGAIFLLSLMCLAFYNDFERIFGF